MNCKYCAAKLREKTINKGYTTCSKHRDNETFYCIEKDCSNITKDINRRCLVCRKRRISETLKRRHLNKEIVIWSKDKKYKEMFSEEKIQEIRNKRPKSKKQIYIDNSFNADENKIECLICHRYFEALCVHLKSKHNISSEKYRKQFPDSKTVNDILSDKFKIVGSKNMSGENNPMFGSNRVGDLNPMYGVSVKDIWIKEYGIEIAKEMWAERNANISEKISGSGNPMYRVSVKSVWIDKYGIEKAEEMWKVKCEHQSKISTGRHFIISEETKQKMSIAAANRCENYGVKYFKRGYYTSIKTGIEEFYASGLELQRMKELDKDMNVIKWTKKHHIVIKYEYDRLRRYIPDFLIQYKNKIVLEETKGRIFDQEKLNLKIEAAKIYCSNNNIEFVMNYGDNK